MVKACIDLENSRKKKKKENFYAEKFLYAE